MRKTEVLESWGMCRQEVGQAGAQIDVKEGRKNGMMCKLEGSFQPPASSDREWVRSGASHRACSAGFRVMGPAEG